MTRFAKRLKVIDVISTAACLIDDVVNVGFLSRLCGGEVKLFGIGVHGYVSKPPMWR